MAGELVNPYIDWRQMLQYAPGIEAPPEPGVAPVPGVGALQRSPIAGTDLTAQKPAENPSWLKQIGNYLAKPGTAVALAQAGKLVNDAGGVYGTPVRFSNAVLDVANARAGMKGMQQGAVVPNTNRMVRPSRTAPPIGTAPDEGVQVDDQTKLKRLEEYYFNRR